MKAIIYMKHEVITKVVDEDTSQEIDFETVYEVD
jgi:hypothetical protein